MGIFLKIKKMSEENKRPEVKRDENESPLKVLKEIKDRAHEIMQD